MFSYNFGEKFVDYLTYRASMNGCFCHSFRCLITTYTLTLCFASRNIQFLFSLFWSRKTTSSISNEVLLLDTLRNVFHVTVTAAVYFSRCSFFSLYFNPVVVLLYFFSVALWRIPCGFHCAWIRTCSLCKGICKWQTVLETPKTRKLQRRIQNPVKNLKQSFLRK